GLAPLREKRYAEAGDELRRATTLDPERPISHLALGCVHLEQKRHADALAEFIAELALDPARSPGRMSFGDAYRAQCRCLAGDALRALGRFDEALAAYRAALRENRRYAAAYQRQGDVLYADLHRPDEAVTSYEMALLLHPLLAEAHGPLGRIAAERGRHREAVDHFLAELIVSPDRAETHRELARSYAALGRHAEAARALEAAQALDAAAREA